MAIKAYSYIRFSSFRQSGGDSVRRQIELANKYADQHGLKLQDTSLRDLGVSAFSGANADTGALGEFIRLVESGDIESGSYLLVENFDRLSRDKVRNALSLLLRLIDLKIVVVTLSDGKIYSETSLDDMSLLMSILIMSRAHEESQMKSCRAKAVWDKRKDEARDSGKFITNSNYPRWLSREGDALILPEENAKILNLIFKWSIEGFGYQKIAEMLNEKSHFTFHKNKPWVGANIHSILRKKSVIGEYQPHIKVDGKRQKDGDPIKGYFPIAVTPAVFLEAQQAITNRNNRGSGYRKGTFVNLFTGLIKCECGKSITLGSQNKSGSSYLKCSGGCKGRTRYQYIEPQILTALSQLKRVTDKYKKPTSNALATVKLEIEALGNKLSSLTDLLMKYPSENTAKALHTIENELAVQKKVEIRLTDEELASNIRGAIVLGNENFSDAKERGIFNSKLKAVLDYILLSENRNYLIYYCEGQPVLEQHLFIGFKKMSTAIYEMDGTLVGNTCKGKPLQLIIDEIDELPDFPSVVNENEELNIIEETTADGATKKVTSNYSV